MKKRVIGGTVFVLLVYLFVLINMFSIAILFFLTVGLYEFIKTMKKEINAYAIFYLIVFLIGILSMYIIVTSFDSSMYIIILISSTMLNDTFAYFTGKAIGKTKFSKTSPNKTIEGLIGGMVVTLIIFLGYLIIFDYPNNLTIFSDINIFISLIIMLMTLVFAVIGDLLESKFKRIYGIKDSGTIIYGHGGVLDRVDSWIGASIIFVICLFLVF